MADVTIGDLTESTTPASTDVIEVEVSSVSSRVTLANVIKRGLAVGSDADGDMYYRASSALARLAKGTALAILRMNSGASADHEHRRNGSRVGQESHVSRSLRTHRWRDHSD